MFSKTIKALRQRIKGVRVEVLVPDFGGDMRALETVLDACPDVLNHNIETVPSLYPAIRPMADYRRSLEILRAASMHGGRPGTKSGLMLGLGEDIDEVTATLRDLREAGCDLLTIGQYMRPSLRNVPVREYIEPAVFDKLRYSALGMGFSGVASGPLVRSSMHAEEFYSSYISSGDENVRV